MIKTVEWTDEGIRLIDQRKLPREEVYVLLRTPEDVAQAIRDMVVRGAPAIGVTAAFGLALGVKRSGARTVQELESEFERLCELMARARPTAVNLFWAIARMRRALAQAREQDLPLPLIREWIIREAQDIYREDLETNERMARHGAALLPDPAHVLTHCNTGALATAGGMGTALGVVRVAVLMGKRVHVYVDETRPFLQGARLTAWELLKDRIPATLITDNMAGYVMSRGLVNCVLVGADRIAANGDVANKIGTYALAILAREHGIPFYVVAPISTLDLSIESGDQIPIEERAATEVTHIAGHPIAPEGIAVANPAFDVTPHRYVTAIVTERGIARPPYRESLRTLAAQPEVTGAPAGERDAPSERS